MRVSGSRLAANLGHRGAQNAKRDCVWQRTQPPLLSQTCAA